MNRKTTTVLFIAFFTVFSFTAFSFAAPVPDTGQTQSYTNTFGEDSDYTINQHSYTDLGNGIVRDNITGLEWQQATAPGTYTWQQAIDYCNNLSLGGKDDWRLPTAKELSTLVDRSIPSSGPMISTIFFPGTVASSYWSSTTYASDTSYAWGVSFYNGIVGSGIVNYGYKTNDYYVRAVRGGQSSNSFVDNSDGTISDTSTGLMWQKATAPGTYTWEQALTYCEGLTLANKSDWRLPNTNELQSIVDYSRYNPSIDPIYSGTVASDYWSSTTTASNTDGAWSVYFDDGYVDGYGKPYGLYVRAVRSGQCGFFGDSDIDGICDDGDVSGVVGDNPCRGGNTIFCDDNCRTIANANQADSDSDGIGDACDAPECGNGILEPGEQCEQNSDCAEGDYCSNCACVTPVCGNSVIEPGEQCDDGNTGDGDGCSANCKAEVSQPITIDIENKGDGIYDYTFFDTGTGQTVIDVQGNNGLINLAGFNYSFDGNPTDGVVGISITNLTMSPGVTKTVTIPSLPFLCAVDSNEFMIGNLNTYTRDNWQACIDNPNAVAWAWWFEGTECGEYGSPVNPADKDRNIIRKYTCEKTQDGQYAVLKGFEHTTIVGIQQPTLIKLADFSAKALFAKVVLQWATESEIDNAGFNIYRAESEGGEYVKINKQLIAAKGSASQGALYEFVDKGVKNGRTYYYKLEDIDLSGKSILHGPVSGTPRLIFGFRD